MSTESNIALCRSITDLLDQGKAEEALAFFNKDAVIHYPGGSDVLCHEAYKEHRSSFPNMKHTIEDMFAVDDKVIIRSTIRGTHKGEFMGIPATGKQVKFTSIAIIRFADGKVAEEWVEYDSLGLMQQLGAVNLPQ